MENINKLTQNVVEYGIEKGYQFIYRRPGIKNESDYIDMYVNSKDIDIDYISKNVKNHMEDNNKKVITLIFKR